MVDSINTSSVPSLLSPHTAITNNADYSAKTDDVEGGKSNNRATLSAPKTDSAENCETCEKTVAVEHKPVHQVSGSAQNEPPGSKIDVVA